MQSTDLKKCPACGSGSISPVFKHESSHHNSLLAVDPQSLNSFGQKVRQDHSQLAWMACRSCDLIFAGKRPPDENLESWYLDLFKLSEERNYDSFPLPAAYVEGKTQSGAQLFAKLNQQGLIPAGGNVLHVRCSTGEFLRLARQNRNCDVTGLDFFPSCVTHANNALGTNTVMQMRGPQPDNPHPGECYDLIIANHMLTHAHDPVTLMANFRTWLKDDGILVLMNEPDHALSLKSWKSYPRGLNYFHKQLFTASTFKSSLAAWGFSAERMFADDPKFKKNMIFVCRKMAPHTAAKVSSPVATKLMKRWALQRAFKSIFSPTRQRA